MFLFHTVGQKFYCDNCQANVTDTVRVSCVVCPEFDLCVECFSRGVECGEHKNDHPYRVEVNNIPKDVLKCEVKSTHDLGNHHFWD